MKTLAAKISRIYGQVTAQEKAGFNQHSKYNYFSEAQLQSYLRPLIAKEGIAIFHSTDKITIVPIQGDKLKIHSTVETSHTIVDSESGETFVCRSVGEGLDTGDKATYKAITGAVKYFYMKLLGISDFSDPENDSQEHGQHDTVQEVRRADPPKTVAQAVEQKPNDFYRKALTAVLNNAGIPEAFVLDGCKSANWIPKEINSVQELEEGKAKSLVEQMPKIKSRWEAAQK